MGRRALADSRRRVNVYISEELLLKFNLIHFDPSRGRPEYGRLSEIINQLLRFHLDDIEQKEQQDLEIDNAGIERVHSTRDGA